MDRTPQFERIALRSKRPVLRIKLALVTLVALASVGCGSRPSDSTLRQTYVDRQGSGVLVLGPGEPIIDRTALAPVSPIPQKRDNSLRERTAGPAGGAAS